MSDVAIIETITPIGSGSFQIGGTFTDKATFKIPFTVSIVAARSLEEVRLKLAQELSNSRNTFDLVKSIIPGEFDLTPPFIPPVDPPTPERIIWNALVIRSIRANQILSFDNPIRVDLQKQVDSLALPEYFE